MSIPVNSSTLELRGLNTQQAHAIMALIQAGHADVLREARLLCEKAGSTTPLRRTAVRALMIAMSQSVDLFLIDPTIVVAKTGVIL